MKSRISCTALLLMVGISLGASPAESELDRAKREIEKMGGSVKSLDESSNPGAVAIKFGCHAHFTDAGFAHLKTFRRLETLEFLPAPTDDQLAAIAGLGSIRELQLSSETTTDRGLKHLKGLANLRTLGLRGSAYTAAGLDDLMQALPNLRSLGFSDGAVTDEGLRCLTRVKALDSFYIESCPVTDKGLEHLTELRNVRSLSLYSLNLSDKVLPNIARLTTLETLYIGGISITDKGLEELKGMTKLRRLTLYHTDVTEDAILKFRKARPDVEVTRT